MATQKSVKTAKAAKSSRNLSPKAISKSASGRASVVKGNKFEDEVADLYRLQGADVIQNIEISGKKVDILATFSYPVRHRTIIECKDEKKAVDANQRVMQFYGLLTAARNAGEADSAEIITRVPWSDVAKGFAHKVSITLLTYTEKLSKLIDFSRYLNDLVSKFKEDDPSRPSEPPLGRYYVDLSAERLAITKTIKIPVIDIYIYEWLKKEFTGQQLAVFGEYGAGKSSLCRKMAHDLASSYLENPNANRIPILLNLREFIGKLDIEAYITSFLDRECRVQNPKIDIFRKMNNAGMLLLILDGFDEMAVKVDADTLESNLMEIEKLVASPKCKVLLTSRPEYFTSVKEEQQALDPKASIFRNREARYEPLRILPWNEKQVGLFLKKRVPLIKEAKLPWTYYRDQIERISSLSDLSQRPALLEMITKTLPHLIESNKPINIASLYETYLTGEIKRQKITKRRELLLTESSRFSLLKHLAIDFYRNEQSAITFSDALALIERAITPPRNEQEAYTREFLTNSFLIRKGDEYIFSHKSILEYLAAAKLHEEIAKDAPEDFGRCEYDYVVLDFLRELTPNTHTLLKWISYTKRHPITRGIYLGTNAAVLLLRISDDALSGRDLSGANLRHANFINADLRKTNLSNADLTNATLLGAKFFEEDIKAANFNHTLISFYIAKVFGNTSVDAFLVSLKKYFNKRQALVSQPLRKYALTVNVRLPLDVWQSDKPRALPPNHLLVEISLPVPTGEFISRIRHLFSIAFSENIAVYHDEYEQLTKDMPYLSRGNVKNYALSLKG